MREREGEGEKMRKRRERGRESKKFPKYTDITSGR